VVGLPLVLCRDLSNLIAIECLSNYSKINIMKNLNFTEISQRIAQHLSTPKRKWIAASVCTLSFTLGLVAFIILTRPTPPPNVWDDGLDDVVGFFFDEDFNRLPPEQRMELLQEFVARFRGGDQQQSALLASVIANVTYDMRKQIEDNMMRLGVDLWSQWGREYEQTSPQDREDYINNLLVELDKMGEKFEGKDSGKTDSERLAKMENQADRDRKQMSKQGANKPPDSDRVSGFLSLYSNQVATRASAKDRAGIIRLTRDITRRLRGQSPKGKSGG